MEWNGGFVANGMGGGGFTVFADSSGAGAAVWRRGKRNVGEWGVARRGDVARTWPAWIGLDELDQFDDFWINLIDLILLDKAYACLIQYV